MGKNRHPRPPPGPKPAKVAKIKGLQVGAKTPPAGSRLKPGKGKR